MVTFDHFGSIKYVEMSEADAGCISDAYADADGKPSCIICIDELAGGSKLAGYSLGAENHIVA
jgi:hypothetical protein